MMPPLSWRQRRSPLVPSGLAAIGDTARRLAKRLLLRDDPTLTRLRGCVFDDGLVLLGAERNLPWVDGVIYLGRDARAPELLFPTTLEPSVSPALFERAIASRLGRGGVPLAIIPQLKKVVPAGEARRLERELIRAFLELR